MHATCDNVMGVWVDGEHVDLAWSTRSAWTKMSSFHITKCNQLLAIQCEEKGAIGGILVSADNGMVSDSTWRCSRHYEEGWNQIKFEERIDWWKNADTHGKNGVAPWKVRPGISANANWIWTGPNDGRLVTVNCRKQL